jgi:hypothetical protein
MRRKRFDPDVWRLLIDGNEDVVTEVLELRRRIAAALRKQFAEVQLVRGELPEHCLSALFNDGHAVMAYTRNIAEASYSARSKDRSKGEEGALEFYWSNGQRDEYPLAHSIPAADAVKGFEYFFLQAELPPWVRWHKDF